MIVAPLSYQAIFFFRVCILDRHLHCIPLSISLMGGGDKATVGTSLRELHFSGSTSCCRHPPSILHYQPNWGLGRDRVTYPAFPDGAHWTETEKKRSLSGFGKSIFSDFLVLYGSLYQVRMICRKLDQSNAGCRHLELCQSRFQRPKMLHNLLSSIISWKLNLKLKRGRNLENTCSRQIIDTCARFESRCTPLAHAACPACTGPTCR
jgi:hypothetical protein